jgi:PAS domain S-box-containing protein
MSVTPADSAALPHEELLRRLEEAEETLRAIREGEVDALVVRPARDEQVFTLQGEGGSYHAFMETMEHGAVVVGPRGEILYANQAFSRLSDKPLAALQGALLTEQFEAAIAPRIAALMPTGADEPASRQSSEIALTRDGATFHYLATASPLLIGVVSGWALTFTDLTDRVRAEKSIAAERAARAIIASANEAVMVCDPAGRITHANAAVNAIEPGELLGRPFHEAIRLKFPDAIGLVQSDDLVSMAIAGQSVQGIEAHAPNAPQVKDVLISAAPLSSSEGVSSGCVITLVDISQRKAAEKQQNLLMAELDHRVKNTLTLVLSILGRTSGESIDEFREAFSGRIHALAATHNLLAAKSWSMLTVADVVSAELAPYVRGSSSRVTFQELNISVKPRAAVALGLIFHELASNAVKYGALSSDGGSVSIRRVQDGEHPLIEWQERGGPPVSPPARKGFGQTVITRSLQYLPEGGAELRFDREGVTCMMRLPAEDIVPAEA